MKKELTAKEKLFCSLYAGSADARGSAARAGYRVSPALTAVRLLDREDVQAEIEQRRQQSEVKPSEICEGLRRLAFGSVADAVRLMLCTEPLNPVVIDGLDLYNVSDIKKLANGGIEIRFFDRLKALEKLSDISSACRPAAENDLIRALNEGAANISLGSR